MYCSNCGKEIKDNSLFCSSCGNKLTEDQNDEKMNYNPPKSKKNKSSQSKLTNAALILSCIAALFTIGALFDMALVSVIGFLFLIPAAIVSCIALVIALIKRKKKLDFPKIDFIKRITAVCLAVILPILFLSVSYIMADSLDYNAAMEAYESNDYERAYELFTAVGDYKNSAEMAKECKYQNAIDLASDKEWEKARELFTDLANEGYKASIELYLYCDVWIQAEIRIDLAENKLIPQLKDPSSYQNLGNTFSYVITDRSSNTLDLLLEMEIKYSATNSFGGRVTDTYNTTANVILTETYGTDAKTLTEIMNARSVHEIVKKYEK